MGSQTAQFEQVFEASACTHLNIYILENLALVVVGGIKTFCSSVQMHNVYLFR